MGWNFLMDRLTSNWVREGGEPELEAFFGGAVVDRDGDGDGDERSGVMMSWSSEALSNGPYEEGRRSQRKAS